MRRELFLTAAAAVLAVGSLAPASAEVEDIGFLPAPIANDYVDANRWTSDSDAGAIPAAIVDFGPVEALVDGDSFDPVVVAEGGALLPRWPFAHPRNRIAYGSLTLPSQRRIRVKANPYCSPGAANIVRCNFYDADLLLLSGGTWNNDSNNTQTDQNPNSGNIQNNKSHGITVSMSQLESLIAMGCGDSAIACYALLFPASGDGLPDFVSSDQTAMNVGAAPQSLSVDTLSLADLGPVPASAPEAPASVMVLIGLGCLALARWTGGPRAFSFAQAEG